MVKQTLLQAAFDRLPFGDDDIRDHDGRLIISSQHDILLPFFIGAFRTQDHPIVFKDKPFCRVFRKPMLKTTDDDDRLLVAGLAIKL